MNSRDELKALLAQGVNHLQMAAAVAEHVVMGADARKDLSDAIAASTSALELFTVDDVVAACGAGLRPET